MEGKRDFTPFMAFVGEKRDDIAEAGMDFTVLGVRGM